MTFTTHTIGRSQFMSVQNSIHTYICKLCCISHRVTVPSVRRDALAAYPVYTYIHTRSHTYMWMRTTRRFWRRERVGDFIQCAFRSSLCACARRPRVHTLLTLTPLLLRWRDVPSHVHTWLYVCAYGGTLYSYGVILCSLCIFTVRATANKAYNCVRSLGRPCLSSRKCVQQRNTGITKENECVHAVRAKEKGDQCEWPSDWPTRTT